MKPINAHRRQCVELGLLDVTAGGTYPGISGFKLAKDVDVGARVRCVSCEKVEALQWADSPSVDCLKNSLLRY
jgi:hypothetical protein